MSSWAGAPKRRRRLVGGTEEDAPGGEEEDQEGQEKLPLESEALLRQLIHQQRSSLHQYRREVACLQRQFEEQRREVAVATQRREAVLTAWGELQSDVLLLKARLASQVDASLVKTLVEAPGTRSVRCTASEGSWFSQLGRRSPRRASMHISVKSCNSKKSSQGRGRRDPVP
ncbi:zinc finger, C3HC4 type (RING finger) domain-containing protein [Toxoplasma gondii ARI]|uniref:Zinc finger, C3HC4 type (RING finger) domain-containing protein n=1 Tax=Toxoplasma gondii ARI TaxID=1074872 RepID=A0A139XIL4_TOXGO|nr:zinc finger, C3HC4 type (RING finger) domain-containing protein [Toxoplasma gondii ARI]